LESWAKQVAEQMADEHKAQKAKKSADDKKSSWKFFGSSKNE